MILLEVKYLRAITDELRAQRGEQNKIKFFGNKIINFRTLWTACDDDIVVDKDKFDDLRTGVVGFSLNAYEDMYTCSPSTSKGLSKDYGQYRGKTDDISRPSRHIQDF